MGSVLSGRFHGPLTPFIDENALDPTAFRTPPFAQPHKNTKKNDGQSQQRRRHEFFQSSPSLCQALEWIQHEDYLEWRTSNHSSLSSSSSSPSPHIACFPLINTTTTMEGSSRMDVAQILPVQAPIVPHHEALVLVLQPGTEQGMELVIEWLQQLAQQPWLAKTLLIVVPHPQDSSSSSPRSKQEEKDATRDAVDNFLNLYLGNPNRGTNRRYASSFNLPGALGGALIRQLLVWEVMNVEYKNEPQQQQQDDEPKLILCPQGRRGLFPNMDLYTTVWQSLNHLLGESFVQVYPDHPVAKSPTNRNNRFSVNMTAMLQPLWTTPLYQWLLAQIQLLPQFVHEWWDHWWEFCHWEWAVATQTVRVPPHASALERGIDSLTVQVVIPSSSSSMETDPQPMMVDNLLLLRATLASMELSVHALSNAHERLHHNSALYTLPRRDGNAYVKHEEFLLPAFLLLVPLILRAVRILLGRPFVSSSSHHDKDENDTRDAAPPTHVSVWAALRACHYTLMVTCTAALLVSYIQDDTNPVGLGELDSKSRRTLCQIVVALTYIIAGGMVSWTTQTSSSSSSSSLQSPSLHSPSVQFVACLVALYMHIPIAFGYVALAFFSAVVWTPLLAFGRVSSPSSLSNQGPRTSKRSSFGTSVGFLAHMVSWTGTVLVLLVTSPFAGLVVPGVFPRYTLYVQFVYIPLHFLLCLMWLS